jgi:hypothetical protein
MINDIINQATKISYFIILFTTLTASIIINIFVSDFVVIIIVNAPWIVGLLSFFIVFSVKKGFSELKKENVDRKVFIKLFFIRFSFFVIGYFLISYFIIRSANILSIIITALVSGFLTSYVLTQFIHTRKF